MDDLTTGPLAEHRDKLQAGSVLHFYCPGAEESTALYVQWSDGTDVVIHDIAFSSDIRVPIAWLEERGDDFEVELEGSNVYLEGVIRHRHADGEPEVGTTDMGIPFPDMPVNTREELEHFLQGQCP